MSSKARLGWGPFFAEQVDDANRGLLFARVIQEHRALLRVAGDSDGWAAVSGRFRHEAGSAADFPVVGDWVTLTVTDHSRAVIQSCLKRRSVVARAAAGRATSRQVIAANVDTVFVVTTATEDLSERRLDRYLTMVWDSGAMPRVIVNKADLMTSGEDIVGWLRARLPFVDVVALSALTDTTLAPLVPYLQPGVTIALVGSSGVGKSTLVNRLLGHDLQRVGAVRESDQTGKHVTSSRQLIELPGGALLIDTPGMRELVPWVESPALDTVFADIVELAAGCRFSDCAHESEPGCAVREAMATGGLAVDRLASYRDLQREAAFEERKRDKSAAAREKRRWKQITRDQRARYRDRERDR